MWGLLSLINPEKHPDAECELRMLWAECTQRTEVT